MHSHSPFALPPSGCVTKVSLSIAVEAPPAFTSDLSLFFGGTTCLIEYVCVCVCVCVRVLSPFPRAH